MDPMNLIPQKVYDNYETVTKSGFPQVAIDYLTAVMEYVTTHKKYQGHNRTLIRLLAIDYLSINEIEEQHGITDKISKVGK